MKLPARPIILMALLTARLALSASPAGATDASGDAAYIYAVGPSVPASLTGDPGVSYDAAAPSRISGGELFHWNFRPQSACNGHATGTALEDIAVSRVVVKAMSKSGQGAILIRNATGKSGVAGKGAGQTVALASLISNRPLKNGDSVTFQPASPASLGQINLTAEAFGSNDASFAIMVEVAASSPNLCSDQTRAVVNPPQPKRTDLPDGMDPRCPYEGQPVYTLSCQSFPACTLPICLNPVDPDTFQPPACNSDTDCNGTYKCDDSHQCSAP